MTKQAGHARVIGARVEELRKIITCSLTAYTVFGSRNSDHAQEDTDCEESACFAANRLPRFRLPAIAFFQHYLAAGFGIASKWFAGTGFLPSTM